MGLTIFFPAFNDAFTIASLVIRAAQAASTVTDDYEIIVVNDGSTDATAAVLDDLALRCPFLRVIHHPRNTGYGGALRSGFAAARKDLIFYTDGDAQYDPAELTVLWTRLQPGIDVVNGYKISRSDPLHRVIVGRLYHHTVKCLFGLRLRDVDCDFRLMRRQIFERVRLEETSGVICLELMKKIQDAGFCVVEAPVHHYHRLSGRSQFFNVRRVLRTLRDVRRLWYELVRRPRSRAVHPHAPAADAPARSGSQAP